MDLAEWESVLQYISEPTEFSSPQPERPVAEMAGISLQTQPPTPSQVLTPPVRSSLSRLGPARLLTLADTLGL